MGPFWNSFAPKLSWIVAIVVGLLLLITFLVVVPSPLQRTVEEKIDKYLEKLNDRK